MQIIFALITNEQSIIKFMYLIAIFNKLIIRFDNWENLLKAFMIFNNESPDKLFQIKQNA